AAPVLPEAALLFDVGSITAPHCLLHRHTSTCSSPKENASVTSRWAARTRWSVPREAQTAPSPTPTPHSRRAEPARRWARRPVPVPEAPTGHDIEHRLIAPDPPMA